jgi:hypothetical protein
MVESGDDRLNAFTGDYFEPRSPFRVHRWTTHRQSLQRGAVKENVPSHFRK